MFLALTRHESGPRKLRQSQKKGPQKFSRPKKEDDQKNEDDLKNEDNFKYEDFEIILTSKVKTIPYQSYHKLSCACFM